MPPEQPAQRESEEHSIKARKHEIFAEDPLVAGLERRPFKEYLRETPPAPLAQPVKIALWAAGVLVVLLLLAGLLFPPSRPKRLPKRGVEHRLPELKKSIAATQRMRIQRA